MRHMIRFRLCSLALAALAPLALGGCFDVEDPEEQVCSAEHPECPSGQVCRNNRCVPSGALDRGLADGLPLDGPRPPDGPALDGPDAGDGAVDAGVDAAADMLADLSADMAGDSGCDSGATRPCYTGPADTRGVGLCVDGTQSCANGSWGACVGQVVPTSETCDGEDNDCDGTIDEGLTQACYTGPSSTLHVGVCKGGTQICTAGIWGGCTGEVTPSAELCDGVDNDCDGITDEGCPCTPGATQPCGSDVGECVKGTQTCDASGAWGPCTGGVSSEPESCDGKDNDCDGQIDEQLTQPCYSGPSGTAGVGSCKEGTQSCTAGQWDTCTGEVTPGVETCDNIDNDCDGEVDEGLTQACYTGPGGTQGVGLCAAGTQSCQSGQWGACTGDVTPASEICDGEDNDCDGEVDEGLDRSCYDGSSGCSGSPGDTYSCTGICKSGTQSCTLGQWGSCAGQVLPQAETCNNADDDCDGAIDEGLSRTCYPSGTSGCTGSPGQPYSCVGACKEGSQTCGSGVWGGCTGAVTPATEICDGLDNDCDGVTDEGCSCVTGTTQPCGSDVGECQKGTQTCDSAGNWGACTGGVPPALEVCDGKDNDCNGKVDEGLYRSCYDGATGCSGTPGGSYSCVGQCQSGIQSCAAGQWGECQGDVLPVPETCNNKDDNCDGQVDENLHRSCYGFKVGCSGAPGGSYTCEGECQSGSQSCSSGQWGSCLGDVGPSSEICDGKDNDCDGKIDEDLIFSTYYKDYDRDGFGNAGASKYACLQPAGYVTNGDDCYDKNKDAHPKQTGFFTKDRGDGSFDYNCDGQETRKGGMLICPKYPYKCVATAGWCDKYACGTIGIYSYKCVVPSIGYCDPYCPSKCSTFDPDCEILTVSCQ